MVRTTASILLLLSLVVILKAAPQEDVYEMDIDVDQILNNKRLLESHIKCYLDKGPCTPPLKKVKKRLPELIDTKCGKCNPTQLTQFRKAFNKIRTSRSKDFDNLLNKYMSNKTKQDEFRQWLSAQ